MAKIIPRQYLHPIGSHRPPRTAGNKAANLHRLIRGGLPVPRSFVLIWEAFDRHAQEPSKTIEQLRQELRDKLDLTRAYAVRSSASIEDSAQHSFAGQFDTLLNVQGEPAIIEAIRMVWASTHSSSVESYMEMLPAGQRELKMAVIIQEMVCARVSGISFSRNPVTGENEVIIEAIEGEGTALVQRGLTPHRWVRQNGSWKSAPADSHIEPGLIEQVASTTREIATWFKMDVDLEWAYDGTSLSWLQLREITSLRNLTVYSNRIAKEVLPGMIKPLVWSINIPLVNSAWIKLLTELVGKNDLRIEDLAKSFYYRTYFNLSTLGHIWKAFGMPQESLEILMGIQPRQEGQSIFKPSLRMLRLFPRVAAFIGNKWGLGKRFERDYPQLRERFISFDWKNSDQLSASALLTEIARLETELKDLAYYNIIVPILMASYTSIFGRYLRRAGVDPALFDYSIEAEELSELVPEESLAELQQDFAGLEPALRDNIQSKSFQDFEQLPGISAFRGKVRSFLDRFGHLSDSGNDFSTIPWREKPELVLNLIAQQPPSHVAEEYHTRFQDLRLPFLHRRGARIFYERARKFRVYREQISMLYTYAYGIFRPYILALGSLFTFQGVLDGREDIFYLTRAEVEEICSYIDTPAADQTPGKQIKDFNALVRLREQEMLSCRDLKLPSLIYGEVVRLEDHRALDRLTGVPTSRGYYTGRVKVVSGLQDSGKFQSEDVLVIPYSDISWTPLIARAGAVIAESGGILSHSSIIAREHQIPAVVSVAGAMDLPDQSLVTVDGFLGEILLHKEES